MVFKCNPNQRIRIEIVLRAQADDKGFIEFDEPAEILKKRMVKAGYEIAQTCVCSQCGETFDNKGLMMAHVKKEHPK